MAGVEPYQELSDKRQMCSATHLFAHLCGATNVETWYMYHCASSAHTDVFFMIALPAERVEMVVCMAGGG